MAIGRMVILDPRPLLPGIERKTDAMPQLSLEVPLVSSTPTDWVLWRGEVPKLDAAHLDRHGEPDGRCQE